VLPHGALGPRELADEKAVNLESLQIVSCPGTARGAAGRRSVSVGAAYPADIPSDAWLSLLVLVMQLDTFGIDLSQK
jgi:hypothetical protein